MKATRTDSKLSIDIVTNGDTIEIHPHGSDAVIATLHPGDTDYIIDEYAWTANLVAESPIDIGTELRAMLSPTNCRLIAAMPSPDASL